ncbi:hypothetical protein, partial [Paraburkholderia hospita]|uniref:hypothetical protein n=1 Tax=Paraburkholderia hospita TaxID=169430 RepID=UPI001A985180
KHRSADASENTSKPHRLRSKHRPPGCQRKHKQTTPRRKTKKKRPTLFKEPGVSHLQKQKQK